MQRSLFLLGYTALVLCLAAALVLFAAPAFSQEAPKDNWLDIQAQPPAPEAQRGPRCEPHASIRRGLALNHMESPAGMGIIGTDSVLELYMSPNGSWSAVVTDAKGIACILLFGKHWTPIRQKAPGELES